VPHAARTPGFVVVMAPPRKRRKYDANPSSDETFAPAKINQDTYPFEQEEETSIRQIIISVGMGAFFALSVPIAQVIDLTTRLTSHHGRSRRGRSPDHAGQGRRYRYREHLRHRDQRGLETPWSRRCPDHVGLFRRTQNHDRCDRPDLESTRMAGFSLFAQSATAIATAQGVWDARRSSTHLNEHQAVRRDNKAAQNLFGIPHRYKAFLNLRFDTANRGVSQDSLERREFYLS